MKKYILIVFILVAIVANATDNTSTSWVLRASGAVFGSTSILPSRSYGVSFAIGNQGYMATGEGPSTLTSALSDCWRYINNGNWDIWAQQADVPGGGRTQAFGFAINGLGYVGGGAGPFLSFSSALYDFYEYNPGTNVWTSKASFITTTTFGVGFIPADRVGSASFVFPNPPFATEAYVIGGGSGLHTSGSAKNTGIQYNPSTNSWTGNNLNFPVPIYDAVGFTLGGNGYVTCGVAHGLSYNPTYRYDGLWHADSNFPGSAIRGKPFVFTVGNFAYAGSGYSSTAANLSDVWSFSVASGWNCAIPSFVGGNLAGTTAFTLTVNGIQRPFVQNGTILNIGGLPPQIPNNLNNEYQPLFVSTTIPGICTPTILGIPFYNDCNYPTGTVFTAQLVTYNGVAYTVVQNLATTTTGGLRTGMFNVTFLSSLTPSGNYALRITASNGPVLMSNITNFFNIGTALTVPPNTLSGPATICVGQTGNFIHNESYVTATGSAATFNWSTSNGNASVINSGNINFVSVPPNTNYQNFGSVLGINPGVVTLSVTGFMNGCSSPARAITVTITGSPLPTITGSKFITVGGVNLYTVNSFPGTTYQWYSSAVSSVAGVISSGFYTSITGYSYGKVVLTVTAFNTVCGTTMNTLTVNVANSFYNSTCASPVSLYFNPGATVNTFTGYSISNPAVTFPVDLRSPSVDFTTYGTSIVVSIPGTFTFDGVYMWKFQNLTIDGSMNFNPGSVVYLSGNVLQVLNSNNVKVLGSTITGFPCSIKEYDWSQLLFINPLVFTVDSSKGFNSLFSGSKFGVIVTVLPDIGNTVYPNILTVKHAMFKATSQGFSVYYGNSNLPKNAREEFLAVIPPSVLIKGNQFIRTGSDIATTTAGLYLEYNKNSSPGSTLIQFEVSKNKVSDFYQNVRIIGSFIPSTIVGSGSIESGFFCNTMSGANSNKHLYVTPMFPFDFNLQKIPSGNIFQGPAAQFFNDGTSTTGINYYVGATDQGIVKSGPGSTNIQPSTYTSPCATLSGARLGNELLNPNSLGSPIPNPASYTVKLPYSIQISEGQEAYIELVNMIGNQPLTYKLSYKEPQGEVMIDLTGYVSGLYVYRLIVDSKTMDVKKLMIVK